jgi:hypothetical protein
MITDTSNVARNVPKFLDIVNYGNTERYAVGRGFQF